jgi:hypothetical protein
MVKLNIKNNLLVLCTALLIGAGCATNKSEGFGTMGSGSSMDNPSSGGGGTLPDGTETNQSLTWNGTAWTNTPHYYAVAVQDGNVVGIDNLYTDADKLPLITNPTLDPWNLVVTNGVAYDYIKIPFDGKPYRCYVSWRSVNWDVGDNYWNNFGGVDLNQIQVIHGQRKVAISNNERHAYDAVFIATSTNAYWFFQTKLSGGSDANASFYGFIMGMYQQ